MQQEAGRPQKEICNTALWTLTRYYYFLIEFQSGNQMLSRHCPDETHCADLRSSVGFRSTEPGVKGGGGEGKYQVNSLFGLSVPCTMPVPWQPLTLEMGL